MVTPPSAPRRLPRRLASPLLVGLVFLMLLVGLTYAVLAAPQATDAPGTLPVNEPLAGATAQVEFSVARRVGCTLCMLRPQ